MASPTCGRCAQRGLNCSGRADPGLLFLDENARAQRNSRLARRSRAGETAQAASSLIIPFEAHGRYMLQEEDVQRRYYWLNDTALAQVPEPLKRDLETRAIERFFLDWTLHPTNKGLTPGYMHDLPALFASTSSGSVLWTAVRAVAFAGLKGYNGGSFSRRARQSYGAALTRMRSIANDNRRLAEDHTLAALLLIDSFELMYLSRQEPLGHHKGAIEHVLNVRGDDQFYHRSRFELWRMAHQRLQAHKLLQRADPDPNQLVLIARLNASLPDLHICADVMRMVILCAAVRRMTRDENDSESEPDKIGSATELIDRMQELIAMMETWTAETATSWQPRSVSASHVVTPQQVDETTVVSPPDFTCPNVLAYPDPWLAYKWNFHAAGQIVLRESKIELLEYSSQLQGYDPALVYDADLSTEREAIERLSSTIVQSLPPLLGFMDDVSQVAWPYPYGQMAGRFFAMCSMWIVQKARFTSPRHKQTAAEVLAWLNDVHKLR